MAQVFTALFNLALRLERERFLGAGLYERNAERRGYANGYKSKTLDTTAGTVTVDVPSIQRVVVVGVPLTVSTPSTVVRNTPSKWLGSPDTTRTR